MQAVNSLLQQIENLVGIIKLREGGHSFGVLAEFEKYSDRELAAMLCKLAVAYLDAVSSQ